MGKVVHCIHRQDLSTAYAFPSSMVCYKSVTHSERSDVLSVRLRISHTYGCLSQDLCLDCCTSNFPFPGEKDGGLASNNMVTTI